MQNQRKSFTLSLVSAALALGLCLVATHALAFDLYIINNSGGGISVECPGNKNYLLAGQTLALSCNQTVTIQPPDASAVHGIADKHCESTQVTEVTVTAATNSSSGTGINTRVRCTAPPPFDPGPDF